MKNSKLDSATVNNAKSELSRFASAEVKPSTSKKSGGGGGGVHYKAIETMVRDFNGCSMWKVGILMNGKIENWYKGYGTTDHDDTLTKARTQIRKVIKSSVDRKTEIVVYLDNLAFDGVDERENPRKHYFIIAKTEWQLFKDTFSEKGLTPCIDNKLNTLEQLQSVSV